MTEQQIQSVWARPKKGREQPALSREQIVAEAIKLLDSDGLDTLSMRNLGKRLDAGATSLYRHVANKDELLELVVDEVYAEIRVPGPADGWRAAVVECAHSVRGMIVRHPWMASVLGQIGLSYLGPNVMRVSDQMIALFESAGFTLPEANLALSAVMSYVIGASVGEAAWLTALHRSGLSEHDWVEKLKPIAVSAAQPYPRLLALVELAETEAGPEANDNNFDYGLERSLDGIEARLPRS